MARTRFRRRGRRRRRRGARSFKRFARRIVRSGVEPRNIEIAYSGGNNIVQGDGTSRVLTIMNLPSNLVQGDTKDDFTGDTVFLKGVTVRAIISSGYGGQPSGDMMYVRFILFHSRANAAGMLGAGAVYGNTTTDTVAPAQVGQFHNPRIFDDTALPFVGAGYMSQLDTTNIKVLKTKMFKINAGGADQATQTIKFYMPINRTHVYQNPDNSALTATPNHGRNGSYYLAFQFYQQTGTGGIASTVIGIMDYHVVLYFRD